MGIEETIRSAADQLEIRNLLARIAHSSDTGSLDEYLDLFLPDASWGGTGFPVRTGHAEIRAGAEQRRAGGAAGPGTHSQHVISTIDVRVDGDRATSRAIFQFYTETQATPVLRTTGYYQDEFQRTPRGWKLASRRITMA
jgi:uncharacterized protein (TIGR02246 family)